MSLDIRLHDDYILAYLTALDCPRALTVWMLYSSNEHEQLAALEFVPADYNTLVEARDSLAATKFLSKATFLNLDRDLKAAALETFFEAEYRCKVTNECIRKLHFNRRNEVVSLLSAMRRKIANILGDFDPDEFVNACNWGPGATTSMSRRRATHPEKFLTESRITDEAYDFVRPWFSSAYPSWNVEFEPAAGSKIVTVPKNAKTDRTIAIEPGINLWFQKGIGTMIRRRLHRVGINLNKQDINGERSRVASKYNFLATVDFSAASDSISTELVNELIPTDWLTLLRAFRSSYGTLDGKPIYFEKFSSMGNGFTFELESLIFFVLALVVCERSNIETKGISVYGDDVIIPSKAFDDYAFFSGELGFLVNRTKSYSSTYYRESCGSHYWNGIDIKPIYLKRSLTGYTELIKAANATRKLAHRRNRYYGCDSRLRECWHLLASSLGNSPRISDGFGDLGLIVNLDEVPENQSVTPASNGYEGVYVKIWAVLAAQVELEHKGLMLFKLKQIASSTPTSFLDVEEMKARGNSIPVNGRTKLARKRLLVPRWYDLGPWI